MKQQQAIENFLTGRRVAIVKFVAHRFKEVCNKAKKVVGIVNLFEVQFADGKAPTVQMWCPRSVQTVEQAAKECPCQFKDGQKLVIEFDLMEPNTFDAKNGVIVRATSVPSAKITQIKEFTPAAWAKAKAVKAVALAA